MCVCVSVRYPFNFFTEDPLKSLREDVKSHMIYDILLARGRGNGAVADLAEEP